MPEYKEELKKLLLEGLPNYEITALPEEKVKELLDSLIAESTDEQKKDVLLKLLAQVIECRYFH